MSIFAKKSSNFLIHDKILFILNKEKDNWQIITKSEKEFSGRPWRRLVGGFQERFYN